MFYECKQHGYVNFAQLTRMHYRPEHVYPRETGRPPEPAHMMLSFSDGITIRTEDRALMAAAQEYVDKNLAKAKG